MAITAWYDVWCDAEGCDDWTSGGASRAAAAKEARRAGWVKEPDGWKCERHRKRKANAKPVG